MSVGGGRPPGGGQGLAGVRVLALEQYRLGPTFGLLLADCGAEVIKVEPPGTGDPGRSMLIAGRDGEKIPFLWATLCRNKKSLTLNIQSEKGAELFKRLVQVSDIVSDNMKAGTLKRLGLGYEVLREINPGIIYVSLTGFGHDSPRADWPAFDLIGQAMSGLMYTMGRETDPPLPTLSVAADTVPAILAAYGALVALYTRQVTGQGQHVDIAMYDSMVMLNNFFVNYRSLTGSRLKRQTRGTPGSAPYGAYRARDGYIGIHVAGDAFWRRFCVAIQRPDLIEDPKFAVLQERVLHQEELADIVESWASDKTATQASELLREAGVAACLVQDADMILACPSLHARNMLWEMEIPDMGKRTVVGNPVRLSGMGRQVMEPPPRLGEHTDEILRTLLDLTPKEIEGLRAAKVV